MVKKSTFCLLSKAIKIKWRQIFYIILFSSLPFRAIFKINHNNYKTKQTRNWMINLICNITGRVDKLDSSFSRSRSSSMSSLENIASESVTCLAFADCYTKKSGKDVVQRWKKRRGRKVNGVWILIAFLSILSYLILLKCFLRAFIN